MPRLGVKTTMWNRPRGRNTLDGGCPYYDTYQTKDGKFMAVGALEPQFFAHLLHGLGLSADDLPGPRDDPVYWPQLCKLFTTCFQSKTRSEWESVFNGTDACCTPVLSQDELEISGYIQRPAISLDTSPARAIAVGNPRSERDGQGDGVDGHGWTGRVITSGAAGQGLLLEWTGLQLGKEIDVVDGSFQLAPLPKI